MADLAPDDSDDSDEKFVRLLSENQLRLRAHVFALIRDASEADDVAQETNSVLWRKRSSYDTTRDFFHWACGVAFIEVLQYRRKRATDRLQFDEALVSTIAVEHMERVDLADLRRAALPDCLRKLSERDQWIISQRYSDKSTVAGIAKSLQCPPSTTYSALAKIRESLFRCIERSVANASRS